LGGEAHKTQFHFQDDRPDTPEPQRPEPPDGVGVWGLVLHMVLMIPLVPPTIIDALVTVLAVVYIHRALGSPTHSIVVTTGAAPTSLLLFVAFLIIMVIGLGLLTWVLTLLARVVLDRRRWQMVLAGALGLLVLGAAVWAFTGAGLAATAAVFGVFAYVALVALGHILWARRHA
jgi:hypothetical protein